MPLYHYSDDPNIAIFAPRPVRVPSERPGGQEWLNGPLVWAIDEWHSPIFFFPRDCPRILVWPLPTTSPEDRERWFAGREDVRMIAHIEWSWFDRLASETLYRYELPDEPFESLHDVGYHVSRTAVTPLHRTTLASLPTALREANVELRVMPSLLPLRDVWDTTLHASGSRLRIVVDFYHP